MNKDLIIIALIILVIYLYYQQKNLDNTQPLAQLQTELNHYQTLYENRVNKDLGLGKNDKATQTFTDYEAIIKKEKEKHNEQLRKINLLFDSNAEHYQTIDFNGLYSLLQQITKRENKG